MFTAKTRKWGNSTGIVIPKEELEKLRIKENAIVTVEIKPKNPFQELFGYGKDNPISREEFQAWRKELEPRF